MILHLRLQPQLIHVHLVQQLYQLLLKLVLQAIRELARMNLPMNIYTQWYWKIDLHNLFHFLRLRADAHAQYEIRVYSDAISKIVADWVPIAYSAFEDYRIGGAFLSEKAIKNIKKLIKGDKVSFEDSNMSKGEWSELRKIFSELTEV